MPVAPVRMRIFLITFFSHSRFVRIEKGNLIVNIEGLESVPTGEYDTGTSTCSIGEFLPPCWSTYDMTL